MGYVRAEAVLPQELLRQIQEYINGAAIYIPRKEDERLAWGEKTDSRQAVQERNHKIYAESQKGISRPELQQRYCLSEKSIQRILLQEKRAAEASIPHTVSICTQWEIVPDRLPYIRRHCARCGSKTDFESSGNFRVNANGRLLDVWLIYQCCHCGTTYNLPVMERVTPRQIPEETYKRFLANDAEQARSIGFCRELLQKHKADVQWDDIPWHVEKPENPDRMTTDTLVVSNPYGLKIRLDRLLARELGVPREKAKTLMKSQGIKAARSGSTELDMRQLRKIISGSSPES